MKTLISSWSSFCLKAAFFIFLTISTGALVNAQTVTFAQFFERTGSQDFVFTNNGTSASFNTVTDGSAIYFIYQNVANLPPVLQGPQLAHISITATTTSVAFQTPFDPARDIQRFSDSITIRIIRDTPAGVGTGTQRNLLTAVITPDGGSQSALAGDDLSDAVAYTASDARQTVVYSSDFLGLSPTAVDNLGLSFSSVNPLLSIGPGNFLNSFTAAGTGTFASNIAPVFNPPTAAGVSINGQVLNGYGRPLSRATVTLIDSSGNSRVASTNTLGFFRFDDVTAGQLVTISVAAKGWTFEPRVIDLVDNVSDIEFYPVQ
jgi:hypothetical protein